MSEGRVEQVGQVGPIELAGSLNVNGEAPAAMPSRGKANPRRGISVSSRRGWGPGAIEQKLAVFAILLCAAHNVSAAENPRQIIEEAQKRTDAKSQRYEGLLQVFDSKGKISDKRWSLERLGSHGASKAVLRFTSPAEVKGIALLIVNHPERASDQWMWTPAIERDRRIALQDRSTRFFGTDFSFEDLEERDVDQYDYAIAGDESVDGAACWKIQSTPKESKSSQYTRSIVWIRKDNYTFARIENYIKDQAVRQLNYSDIQNVQGIWTARQMEMTDLRRGSRTRLTLDKLKYNVPVKDEDFTLQAIRRQ
jgi:outer membrane lipoprotein-sorting protein